jgi:hypothetical protein
MFAVRVACACGHRDVDVAAINGMESAVCLEDDDTTMIHQRYRGVAICADGTIVTTAELQDECGIVIFE